MVLNYNTHCYAYFSYILHTKLLAVIFADIKDDGESYYELLTWRDLGQTYHFRSNFKKSGNSTKIYSN